MTTQHPPGNNTTHPHNEDAMSAAAEQLKRLEIESLRLDVRIAEQRIRLAPWWFAVKALAVLAAILWMAVFVMWALGLGAR
jgi:hypothetical protein